MASCTFESRRGDQTRHAAALTSTTAVVTADVMAEASRKQEEAAEVKTCVGAGEQQLAWQAHGP